MIVIGAILLIVVAIIILVWLIVHWVLRKKGEEPPTSTVVALVLCEILIGIIFLFHSRIKEIAVDKDGGFKIAVAEIETGQTKPEKGIAKTPPPNSSPTSTPFPTPTSGPRETEVLKATPTPIILKATVQAGGRVTFPTVPMPIEVSVGHFAGNVADKLAIKVEGQEVYEKRNLKEGDSFSINLAKGIFFTLSVMRINYVLPNAPEGYIDLILQENVR